MWTEAQVLANNRKHRQGEGKAEGAQKPKGRNLAAPGPTGEPPMSAAAALHIYKVKQALARAAEAEAGLAWAAYQAIWEREEKAYEGTRSP